MDYRIPGRDSDYAILGLNRDLRLVNVMRAVIPPPALNRFQFDDYRQSIAGARYTREEVEIPDPDRPGMTTTIVVRNAATHTYIPAAEEYTSSQSTLQDVFFRSASSGAAFVSIGEDAAFSIGLRSGQYGYYRIDGRWKAVQLA